MNENKNRDIKYEKIMILKQLEHMIDDEGMEVHTAIDALICDIRKEA